MPVALQNYIEQLRKSEKQRRRLYQTIVSLSLLVTFAVFWALKITGIGVAGEAFCGKDEHAHSQECSNPCPLEEHIHDESCYSNIYADLETEDDWEKPLKDIAKGPTVKENLILVAKSQLGYTESTLNFQVDAQGVRRGITRYGQWYGTPYGDWSATFASFCLYYAGARNVPMGAGPEALRISWETAGLFRSTSSGTPQAGNLLFLNKDTSTQGADAVAVITEVSSTTVTVIEGNLEDTVQTVEYLRNDPAIMGFGMVPNPDAVVTVTPAPNYASYCTLWLDGTDGGLGYLSGSPNTSNAARVGSVVRLPASWTSPSKYSYVLRGWYDVVNNRYYPAGGEMTVTGNTVLYADWVAATYDLGVFTAQVADTVSTNSFITTHMFDYNYLFNVQSADVNVSVTGSSHSETWNMVGSGNVDYGSTQTLNFIFVDNDGEGRLCIPGGRTDQNRYHDATTVTSGIYSSKLGDMLFNPDTAFDPKTGQGIMGKTYLGTGDHLFQLMSDPNDEHYGYYYYDSKKNAASYNQTNGRFYVYEYLSATSDSIGGAYSDFLPLNSPYANTNGKNTATYTFDGHSGEYQGVTHCRFDSKYDSGDYNSTGNVSADYAYGLRSDISFYLPNDPGQGGNKDLHGNDVQFQFSGDDDLWVLVDGVLVLDIGGIHQAVNGNINFSTGQITVNGVAQPGLAELGIGAGDHTLTILYLERGSSMSNCSIYFNLAPRFSLEMQKEDVLTQQLLNGTEFSVYLDHVCTVPAELWGSEDEYRQDLADGVLDQSRNTFVVKDGAASLWGLGSGNTYYIKETGPPAVEGYGLPKGVIRLTLDKEGVATYNIEVLPDAQGNQPSAGFTVHGAHIDEEIKKVYFVVTNAPESVVETTTVQVIKRWEDNKDHSEDYIRAYLTVTDPDGTVRRIREVTLSDENEWTYIWTGLPKYDYDALQKVQYGVVESYESGYYSTVREITEIVITKTQWAESLSFQNGKTYLLKTGNGYLSTLDGNADTGYKWVNEETAKTSPAALWTASTNGTTVKLTNGLGQTITFYYNGGNATDFFATSDPPNQQSRQEFSYSNRDGGLQIFYKQGSTNYYLTGSMNSSGKFGYSTNAYSSLLFTPICEITTTEVRQVEDWAYQITNTPLPSANETSVSVKKEWSVPAGYGEALYQEFVVTVRLFANGENTGRSVTLTLKNGWQDAFLGLPYKDEEGNVIVYTVDEVWEKDFWSTHYGEITVKNGSGGTPPTYSAVITNKYHPGGPVLPATGSFARLAYILCGSAILLGTLVYGIASRRKGERRVK